MWSTPWYSLFVINILHPVVNLQYDKIYKKSTHEVLIGHIMWPQFPRALLAKPDSCGLFIKCRCYGRYNWLAKRRGCHWRWHLAGFVSNTLFSRTRVLIIRHVVVCSIVNLVTWTNLFCLLNLGFNICAMDSIILYYISCFKLYLIGWEWFRYLLSMVLIYLVDFIQNYGFFWTDISWEIKEVFIER